ncbi:hypothetical protein ABG768_027884, partial [Culter alburnus]
DSSILLAHALLHADCPRGLEIWAVRGQGVRPAASPPHDENYVMRTVHEHGRPKYTR